MIECDGSLVEEMYLQVMGCILSDGVWVVLVVLAFSMVALESRDIIQVVDEIFCCRSWGTRDLTSGPRCGCAMLGQIYI